MYAETDFFLAQSKTTTGSERSPSRCTENTGDELWTSQFTLIELLMVAYREERDTERVVSNAANPRRGTR